MPDTPTYYLLVWRDRGFDHVLTETYADLDVACMEFSERDRLAWDFLGAIFFNLTASGPRWAPLDMVRAADTWKRDKVNEQKARDDERARFRAGLI